MSATFAFSKRVFDDAFHTLDRVVADVARSTPGYLGEERREQPSNELVLNVCFRQGMKALQALMQHPAHIDARQFQQQSLAGYQVVFTEGGHHRRGASDANTQAPWEVRAEGQAYWQGSSSCSHAKMT